jgi:hypothetical protein
MSTGAPRREEYGWQLVTNEDTSSGRGGGRRQTAGGGKNGNEVELEQWLYDRQIIVFSKIVICIYF